MNCILNNAKLKGERDSLQEQLVETQKELAEYKKLAKQYKNKSNVLEQDLIRVNEAKENGKW